MAASRAPLSLDIRERLNERRDFLARACAGDDELRREVESVINGVPDFIESPALEVAAKMWPKIKAQP